MRRFDRYLIREMVGPFVFGLGAFLIVTVGIDLIYRALDLILNNGLPAGPVLKAMAYRLPWLLVLCFPGAMIFSTLMSFGELSGHGEITAMRAGGIGLWRMAVPTLTLAVVVSVVTLILNVWTIPFATAQSAEILAELRKQSSQQVENVVVMLPPKGVPQIVFIARQFDPDTNVLRGLWIAEFRDGNPKDTILAESATWEGDAWVLQRARKQSPDGKLLLEMDQMQYALGPNPLQMAASKRKTADMTVAELQGLMSMPPGTNDPLRIQAQEEWSFRVAVPWAALGLALVGLPLGIRPQRTSTGVGLGISLAVILAYYIAMSAMRILGQQGHLPPMVADWMPNLLLYTTGLGLLINKSR